MIGRPTGSTRTDPLFPYPRSSDLRVPAAGDPGGAGGPGRCLPRAGEQGTGVVHPPGMGGAEGPALPHHRTRSAHPPGTVTSRAAARSDEHTSELQSLMGISYAVFCLKKKTKRINNLKRYQ